VESAKAMGQSLHLEDGDMISKTSSMQPTATRYYHRETGSALALGRFESHKYDSAVNNIPVGQFNIAKPAYNGNIRGLHVQYFQKR
jgi:hypothetical protein